MESSESISKTRLKIAGAFGNDIRELFSVEIKPGQIVGAYNYGGSPRHFTKHDDGMLHEKSDPENRLLWERVGQPLTALTGSESLGTYSFTVASRDDLPRFKPGQRVTSLLFQAQEGKRADVVVVALGRPTDNAQLQQVSQQFVGQGFQSYLDPIKGIAVGFRQQASESSSVG
ncbi:MAG TPA: hypothetical protein VEO18_00445 [Thermoplasmata archaeon]|nr:hypothetical protein [Thermoplasmata archaeon]